MHKNLIDITGQRFGKLVVEKLGSPGSSRQSRWWCKCDCGNLTIVDSRYLRSGMTTSCGCASVVSRKAAYAKYTAHKKKFASWTWGREKKKY